MMNQYHPEDHYVPDQEDPEDDDDFLQELARMDEEDEEDDGPAERRGPNEILGEIEQIVRPSHLTALKTPTRGETWRNIHNRKVYTVEALEQVPAAEGGSVVIVNCGPESSRIALKAFREAWEKYTESETAANAPPQAGETWQNIHTGYKVVVNSVKQGRQGLEIIHSSKSGKILCVNIGSFVANNRRIKGSSQWFVGALKFGD